MAFKCRLEGDVKVDVLEEGGRVIFEVEDDGLSVLAVGV